MNNDVFNRGTHFEERLMQALIADHKFAEQMVEVLDVDYFSIDYLKKICKILFVYYGKYNAFPSFKLLVGLVDRYVDDETYKPQCIQYLKKIQNEPLNGDLEYIKEESLDYCRKRKLIVALEEVPDLIADKKYDEISLIVQKALQAGSEKTVGHNLKEQLEQRLIEVIRDPIPTGWHLLNEKLKGGGVGKGELCCVCAPTGHGKSHLLVDLGASAAMMGKNVVHYTLELTEEDTGNRYDARISGVSVNVLRENKEKVLDSLQNMEGNVYIKSYPARKLSIVGVKNHLSKLAMNDFNVDLIIIDYADLMSSRKQYDQRRFEEEAIFQELKGLATELGIPVWTATQANRDAEGAEVITLKHVAEAYAKSWITDLFVTFCRRKDGMGHSKIGTVFIAKSRMGPDGISFASSLDTELSYLELASAEELDRMAESEDDKLKRRLKELKKDKKQDGEEIVH